MPTYHDGSEKKYFPAILAILLALVLGLGYFVYTRIVNPGEYENVYTEEINGVPYVDVNALPEPSGEPDIAPPITPPPQQ